MKIANNYCLLAAFVLSLCALIASDFGMLFCNINNVIQSVTNIVLAATAIYGVNTWKRQEHSNIVNKYRVLFYESKGAFKDITAHVSSHLKDEIRTPWIGHRAKAELYRDIFIKIESSAVEFGVKLGKDAENIAREIVRLYIRYTSELDLYEDSSRRLQDLKEQMSELHGTTINGRTMDEAYGYEVHCLENEIQELISNFFGDKSKYNEFFEREDILKIVNHL